MTSRPVKITLYVLILLLLVLQYPLWLGNGSVIAHWKLKQEMAAQQAENASLRAHNQTLEAELSDLKQGLESAEARARAELGMVKKGESFYQIIENKIAATSWEKKRCPHHLHHNKCRYDHAQAPCAPNCTARRPSYLAFAVSHPLNIQ